MRAFFFSVSLNPVAFFPLNGQYETTDISHSHNLPGQASGVELAPGPDGSVGGSYQFTGNFSSFIYFPNNGGLDTRYSMTFLAWIYHEQTEGPIFYYSGPEDGIWFKLNAKGRFRAKVHSQNFSYVETMNSGILEAKTWHFVGASYNYVSGEFILWINGSIYKEKVIDSPSELATQQSVVMGAIPGHADRYKGRISCVQLYDRVLTELEIEDVKQSCFTVGMSIFYILTLTLKLSEFDTLHFFIFSREITEGKFCKRFADFFEKLYCLIFQKNRDIIWINARGHKKPLISHGKRKKKCKEKKRYF